MQVTAAQYKNYDVVKVVGRVDSTTSPKLAEALDAITAKNRFKIIVDLSEVDFMSSAGLRVLIGAQKTCKRYNRGEVVLAGVPKRIHDALELVGFVPLFRFVETVEQAVS